MSITDNLRDAAYIAIGMGVITVQRAQVRRRELQKQFEEQRAGFEAMLSDAAKQAGPVIADLRSRAGI